MVEDAITKYFGFKVWKSFVNGSKKKGCEIYEFTLGKMHFQEHGRIRVKRKIAKRKKVLNI